MTLFFNEFKEQKMRKEIIAAVIAAAGTIIASLLVIYLTNPKTPSDHAPYLSNHEIPSHDSTKSEGNIKVLAGMIVNEVSKRPIGQARITIVGRNEYDISQDNGNFKIIINDGRVNTVRLEISKKHYKIVDLSFDIPNEKIMIQMSRQK